MIVDIVKQHEMRSTSSPLIDATFTGRLETQRATRCCSVAHKTVNMAVNKRPRLLDLLSGYVEKCTRIASFTIWSSPRIPWRISRSNISFIYRYIYSFAKLSCISQIPSGLCDPPSERSIRLASRDCPELPVYDLLPRHNRCPHFVWSKRRSDLRRARRRVNIHSTYRIQILIGTGIENAM
jgi:hypothetical protein